VNVRGRGLVFLGMATTHIERRQLFAVLGVGLGAVVLAGCGSSGNDNASGGTGSSGSTATPTTVAERTLGSDTVLVDGQQRTLYVSDQEQDAVLCRSTACTEIWEPLTVTGSARPTGPADVRAHLGTVARPDGARQVTLDGRPLYSFSLDNGPGDTHGDGQQDSFDGTDFVWHEATASGAASSAPSASPSDDSSGDSSGGGVYGY
jgi:predicted lipoprotein with Yx(FWY)xxD motif